LNRKLSNMPRFIPVNPGDEYYTDWSTSLVGTPITKQYGLTPSKLARANTLQKQLDDLQAMYTRESSVMLGPNGKPLQISTWDKQRCMLLGYMGFVHTHYGVSPECLTFQHVMDPEKVVQFVSFLVYREALHSINHIVTVADKISNFMSKHEQNVWPSFAAPKFSTWLHSLRSAGAMLLPTPNNPDEDMGPALASVKLMTEHLVATALKAFAAASATPSR